MIENTEIEGLIDVMKRAQEQILDSIRVERELRARIEQQQALIAVAQGYLRSDRPDLAALVLNGYKDTK